MSVYDRVKKGDQGTKAPDRRETLIGAVNRCFATEDGKRVLHYLMDSCNWNDSVISANERTADLNDRGTLYMAARREVYRELRSMIDNEILKEVEFHIEQQPADEAKEES